MDSYIQTWIIPMAISLIANLITALISTARTQMTKSTAAETEAPTSKPTTKVPITLRAVLFFCLGWELQALVLKDGPPSRMDVALIAFWVTLLVILIDRLSRKEGE